MRITVPMHRLLKMTNCLILAVGLAACGGGGGTPGGGGGGDDKTLSTYRISGVVSGLASGAQLTLNNNGSDPLVVSANGTVSFAKAVAQNGSYVVTVDAQPVGQTCTVSNGSGTGVTGNVSNVQVTCSNNSYTISGSVSGLAVGQQVTLKNNGADDKVVAANGTFSFSTTVAHGGGYAVRIGTQPTGQICTVSNGSGSGVAGAINNIAVHCSAITYTVGGNVSGLAAGEHVTLLNNDDDATPVAADGAFTFTTPVAQGGGYAVTVGTHPPSQTCSVSSGTGSNVGANITTVQISCVERVAYAYVALAGSNQIGQYRIDNANGSLTEVAPPVAAGTKPVSIAVDPTGRYAYATNVDSGNISQYSTENGELHSKGTVAAGSGPQAIAFDSTGRFAYVVNSNDDTVAQYSIGVDGLLSALATVPTGDFPRSITVDPTGQYAYVANDNGASISQYAITNGALVPMTTVPLSGPGYSIALDPLGRFAYVADFFASTVSQFAVGAGGSLSPMAPATVGTGTNPNSIAIDPKGRYAYVANANSANVSQYTIDSVIGLSAMTPVGAVAAGSIPASVALNPTGRFAYVSTFAGNLYQYDVTPGDGTLVQKTIVGGLNDPRSITTAYAPR